MKLKAVTLGLALVFAHILAQAQSITVADAWIRATQPGQKATGAFMKLTSKDGSKLVAVATPVAGVAEVHEMKMENGVMTMRAVAGGLELPAGKAVELAPGGYHLMLMDLKNNLAAGSTAAVTLTLKNAKGEQSKLELKVPVLAKAPAPAH